MKKLFLIMGIAAVMCGFTACGESNKNNSTTTPATTTQPSVTTSQSATSNITTPANDLGDMISDGISGMESGISSMESGMDNAARGMRGNTR